MRSSEICALKCHDALDCQTGQLRLPNRSLFLPSIALRPLRRILTLPESASEDFLRIDSGFLRRTFYAMAKQAQLPPECCAPRALRYARAIEMCDMRMPLRLVARSLGMPNVLHLEKLLRERQCQKDPAAESLNTFTALVTGIEAGHWSAALTFQIPDLGKFHCLCQLEELLTMEPGAGQAATFHIPPWAIQPHNGEEMNRLNCKILETRQDALETCLELQAGPGLRLRALIGSQRAMSSELSPGNIFSAHVSPHLIQLKSCS